MRIGFRWPDDELSGKWKVILRTHGMSISTMAMRIGIPATTPTTTNARWQCVPEDDDFLFYL